jgi:type I restriction enzyme S subunit
MALQPRNLEPKDFPDEVFDYYSIPAFDQGEPEQALGRHIGSAKQVIRPGDVLLSRIVPHIRRAWVVEKDSGKRIIGSGEWIVFRNPRFHARYLRHLLTSDSFHSEFMSTVCGVGGSLLRARPANVARLDIHLPPIDEQQRIAAILDKAEALRGKRRQALAKLDTLTQSLFLEMFGDPATNPNNYEETRLEIVCTQITDGEHLTPRRTTQGIKLLSARNIRNGYLDFSDVDYIDEAEHIRVSFRCKPQRNDVYSRARAQ